jgi:hypothetical protein
LALGTFSGIGAIAGACSAFVFTVVHHLVISPIWFAFPAMLAAGALCGTSLAWSYAIVTRKPSPSSWFRYNLLYLLMFVALGILSMSLFEPVTTIAALLATTEPPVALVGQALPMSAGFTLVTALVLCLVYRPSMQGGLAILLTASVLVLLLGLNISILGFVDVPIGEARVLATTFGLLLILALTYTIGVSAIAHGRLPRARSA